MARYALVTAVLAGFAAAVACSSFEESDPTTGADGGPETSSTAPPPEPPPGPTDAGADAIGDAGTFCDGIFDATVCQDFDRPGAFPGSWTVTNLNADAGFAIQPKGASPPKSLLLWGGATGVNCPADAGWVTLTLATGGLPVEGLELRFKLNLSDNDGGISPGQGNIGPNVAFGTPATRCAFYFSNNNGVPTLRYDSPSGGSGKAMRALKGTALGVDEWLDVDLKVVPSDAGTSVEINGADAGYLTDCKRTDLTRIELEAHCSTGPSQAGIDDLVIWTR